MILMAPCPFCRHLDRDRPGSFCTAYPDGDGIPAAIIDGSVDHRKAYPGDRGIRFEPTDARAARLVADQFSDESG